MKTGICSKCGHGEVIQAKAADYAHESTEREMAITADPRWVMGGRNPNRPHGVLYTYTCRSCGYTEWYAMGPRSIPIGPKFKTKLIRQGAGAEDGESSEPVQLKRSGEGRGTLRL